MSGTDTTIPGKTASPDALADVCALPAPGPKAVTAEVAIERWTGGATTQTTDQVAEESPVALVYHGVPHVVMLATPSNLEDFAVGFTLSEGLVERPDEIRAVEVIQ